MRHRRDIEGLRAVAVIAVVLYHFGVPGFDGGYVGVDVFFVVSGFLITSILVTERQSTGRISFRDFYARRVRRLLPISAVVLVVTALASAVWLDATRHDQLVDDIVAEIAVPAVPNGLITGGDISPDGRRVALCDYVMGYELTLPDGAAGVGGCARVSDAPPCGGSETRGTPMTDLLDKRKFYIDGAWAEPARANDLEVIDPSTEEPVAVTPRASSFSAISLTGFSSPSILRSCFSA